MNTYRKPHLYPTAMKLIHTQIHNLHTYVYTHACTQKADMALTGCRAINSCSGISPSVTSILCYLANGSSPIIIDEGKPILIPTSGITGGVALNGIGNSPGELVMWPGGGGLVDMLAEGGTGEAEVIDDGLLRRGVLNDGGLGGATISAGKLVISWTFGPMLGSTDL